jgi:hypothetical protein
MLIEKGTFTKEEFMEMVKVADQGMKREKEDRIGRRYMIMKSILIAVLVAGVVISVVSSCATVPKEPLAPGEVRLSSIDVPGAGLRAETSFPVNVFFEAVGNPQIKRACFYESGVEPYCFDISDASYFILGTKRAFQVYLPGLSVGSHRVECYAEYIRDGETRKTNVVFTQITAGVSP